MKQREIKFRAWNAKEKLMSDPFGLIRGTIIWRSKQESAITYASLFPEYTVMQWTGLLDKNGKEIYESDVVLLEEPNRMYTVEWTEFTFKLVHADPKLDRMEWGSIQRIGELGWAVKLIGNIYNNPELLTEVVY